MPTTASWIVALLMGCGFCAASALIGLKPTFVRAAVWKKLLFFLMFILSSIPMVLVFAFGLHAFRPPLLYACIAAYAGFWIVTGYLQRIGIIAPRAKFTSYSR
jgi:hypothetical protein